MTATSTPFAIPAGMAARIAAELETLEQAHGIRILFAIESGSRAWGFPSPDSDFDVRFIYARPVADYLRLEPLRDVVERPVDPVLDINGWDIAKALKLLARGNPTLLEWAVSPLVYRCDGITRPNLVRLSEQTAWGRAAAYHYRHLAERQVEKHLASGEQVKLKTYFYVLRPLLNLRFLRRNPGQPLPMHLDGLLAGCALPDAIANDLNALRRLKAETIELGNGPRRPSLDDFIAAEFSLPAPQPNDAPAADMAALLDAEFWRAIGFSSPAG